MKPVEHWFESLPPALRLLAALGICVLAAFSHALGVWQLIRSCLEEDTCRNEVREAQAALSDEQENLSEVERNHREGARKKVKGMPKKSGLPRLTVTAGKTQRGKKAPVKGTVDELENKTKGSRNKMKESKPLYPVTELAALSLKDSEEEWDTLDSAEEAELDEEATQYEKERYHPDDWPPKHHVVASAPPQPNSRRANLPITRGRKVKRSYIRGLLGTEGK